QSGASSTPSNGGSMQAGGEAGAPPSSAGEPTVGGAGAAGEGGAAPKPECTEAADCALPETKPPGCAEAQCVDSKCVLAARDGDGDGFTAKRCQSLDPDVDIPVGEDCDDADKTVNPDGWDGPAGDGHANGCNDQIDQDCSGIVDDEKLANGGT